MKEKYLSNLNVRKLNQIEMKEMNGGGLIVDGCIVAFDFLKQFWDGFCDGYNHK